ncbi:MAG: 50S ribosomal protein L23 [Candidatus Aenigmarchaeota archaeon]|nr:50S ribosomal protein L23 [Candidatus Aenigmarchaeota archaeon]
MAKKESRIRKYVPFLKGGAGNKTEKAEGSKEVPAVKDVSAKDSLDTLKFVLMTEKAVQLIETQNKLVFIVDRGSAKNEIKKAAEDVFNTKVNGVTTTIDQEGRKKAFVKFAKEGEAGEIAIRLGII